MIKLEEDFGINVFQTKTSYDYIYKCFKYLWDKNTNQLINNRKFKLTRPNPDYFDDNYKPIELN